MVARVNAGQVGGGVVMRLCSSTMLIRPQDLKISMFKVYHDGAMVGDPVELLVQPTGGATQMVFHGRRQPLGR